LHAYMDRWHGKHPSPWDFFYTFDNVSGRNLNWFWSNWFISNNYIDLGVKGVAKSGSNYAVTVDNIGGMVAPFDVVLNFTDGSTLRTHETPAVWERNQKQTTVSVRASKKLKSVVLDGGIWVDANVANNTWTVK
ncbi:MAG: M1 family peptidase, partial [Gemmatimonadaceae bacterium]